MTCPAACDWGTCRDLPVAGACDPFWGDDCGAGTPDGSDGADGRGIIEGATTGDRERAGPGCEGLGGTSVLLGGIAVPATGTVEAWLLNTSSIRI